jgi:hypothetical protein
MSMKRVSIRLALVIPLAVALAFVAYGLHGRLFEGDIRQYQVSPDWKNIVEVREYHQSSATSTDLITVELRTRANPFRRTVLGGLDYGADLSVKWIDSRNLLVRCTKCGSFNVRDDTYGSILYVLEKETTWHDVSIHYSIE